MRLAPPTMSQTDSDLLLRQKATSHAMQLGRTRDTGERKYGGQIPLQLDYHTIRSYWETTDIRFNSSNALYWELWPRIHCPSHSQSIADAAEAFFEPFSIVVLAPCLPISSQWRRRASRASDGLTFPHWNSRSPLWDVLLCREQSRGRILEAIPSGDWADGTGVRVPDLMRQAAQLPGWQDIRR